MPDGHSVFFRNEPCLENVVIRRNTVKPRIVSVTLDSTHQEHDRSNAGRASGNGNAWHRPPQTRPSTKNPPRLPLPD